jgi:hypothetical protein
VRDAELQSGFRISSNNLLVSVMRDAELQSGFRVSYYILVHEVWAHGARFRHSIEGLKDREDARNLHHGRETVNCTRQHAPPAHDPSFDRNTGFASTVRAIQVAEKFDRSDLTSQL